MDFLQGLGVIAFGAMCLFILYGFVVLLRVAFGRREYPWWVRAYMRLMLGER